MRLPVSGYATLVFDCDGVVLNSNKIKTNAFYQAALPYGEAAAQALAEYHVAHGGISRYQKFSYFIEQIAPTGVQGPDLGTLLESYADQVRQGLLTCEMAEGLPQLREHTANARWLIVSGGDQAELRDVFSERGLEELFDGGIFGSPDAKGEILSREFASGNIQKEALFLGDSKYDYQAAIASDLDFVFLSNWTEVIGWRDWCLERGILHKACLEDLVTS